MPLMKRDLSNDTICLDIILVYTILIYVRKWNNK